jgi:hypothetical protein
MPPDASTVNATRVRVGAKTSVMRVVVPDAHVMRAVAVHSLTAFPVVLSVSPDTSIAWPNAGEMSVDTTAAFTEKPLV